MKQIRTGAGRLVFTVQEILGVQRLMQVQPSEPSRRVELVLRTIEPIERINVSQHVSWTHSNNLGTRSVLIKDDLRLRGSSEVPGIAAHGKCVRTLGMLGDPHCHDASNLRRREQLKQLRAAIKRPAPRCIGETASEGVGDGTTPSWGVGETVRPPCAVGQGEPSDRECLGDTVAKRSRTRGEPRDCQSGLRDYRAVSSDLEIRNLRRCAAGPLDGVGAGQLLGRVRWLLV